MSVEPRSCAPIVPSNSWTFRLKTAPAQSIAMTYRFPSEEWTVAYKDAVNANAAYRVAGRGWTHGRVAMVIRADKKLGFDQDLAMILDVDQGTCRGTQFVQGMDRVTDAPFIIVADYARWKEVLGGKLDPIK